MLKLIRSERQYYPNTNNTGPFCDISYFENNIELRAWSNDHFVWLKNGLIHRTDGYADYRIIRGKITESWFYLNGQVVSREEWFDSLTEEEQVQAIFNMDEWR